MPQTPVCGNRRRVRIELSGVYQRTKRPDGACRSESADEGTLTLENSNGLAEALTLYL